MRVERGLLQLCAHRVIVTKEYPVYYEEKKGEGEELAIVTWTGFFRQQASAGWKHTYSFWTVRPGHKDFGHPVRGRIIKESLHCLSNLNEFRKNLIELNWYPRLCKLGWVSLLIHSDDTTLTTFNDWHLESWFTDLKQTPPTGVNYYRHHTNDLFTTLTLRTNRTNRTERPNFIFSVI